MDRRQWLKAAAGAAICPLCLGGQAHAESGHWGYSGPKGPANWGGVCGTGARQSPVNLAGAANAAMPALRPNWSTQAATIENNGHTIKVNTTGAMDVGRTQYQLVQFHFHRRSEHRINNRDFDMEAHFVHAGPQGSLGVVGVMMQAGGANAAFAKIVGAMPAKGARNLAAPAGVRASDFLPSSLGYYSYQGSLTTPTPDCLENVNWMVLATPIQVAAADIAKFATQYPNNARPVMDMKGRKLVRSS